MKLYHFTAKHLLDNILKEGLTKGSIPRITEKGIEFVTPIQWLTCNKDFNQVWCREKAILNYSRNDVRLTIKVPKSEIGKNLQKWEDIATLKEFETTALQLNDKEGDYKNWYVYAGTIKRHWIRKIEYKCEEIEKTTITTK